MKHKKLLLIPAIFLFYTLQIFGQTGEGTIRGQVTDTLDNPISNINIALQNTQKGASTDANGRYRITGVPAGTHTLVVTGIGFEVKKKQVSLEANEVLVVDVGLNQTSESLSEITVSTERVNKFTTQQTEYVAKIPMKDIDNPQVYSSITSELLESQVVTNFEEALQNATGLFKLWESTGRGNDGAGFYSLRGFAVQPTMVNGLPSLTNGSLDPANIERVEVLKGPAGTLFANSVISFGGLINVVTKKPYDELGGDISYTSGSFGLNKITADVNVPIDKAQNLNFRVNGSYNSINSFQDAGFRESFFIAPSITYDASDRLSLEANIEFLQSEQTNPTMLFLRRSGDSQANNIEELGLNNELSFTSNNITIKNPTLSAQVKATYQLSENWTSHTILSRSKTESDGLYTWLFDFTTDGSHTFTRFLGDQNSTTLGTTIQQNINGKYEVAGFNNKLVAGIDFFRRELINNSTGFVPFGQVTPQGAVDNPDASVNLSESAAQEALESSSVSDSKAVDKTLGFYFSNVTEWHPRLSTMASLRVDRFADNGLVSTDEDNFTQTELSPKVGIVFKPVMNRVSLFANYMNGFENEGPRVQSDGSTVTFQPEQARQWEAGVKTNFLNGRVTSTISYYNIDVSDVIRQDPDTPNSFIQDGEIESYGVEFSVTANPTPGMNITLGYSHNEAENIKFNPDFDGLRPERAGPKNLFDGWFSYQFTGGTLEGFGFGFGANYASKHRTLNRVSTGQFILPEYTIFNGSVFYDAGSFRINIKADNISDKEYFTGWSTINPQQERSVKASVRYSF